MVCWKNALCAVALFLSVALSHGALAADIDLVAPMGDFMLLEPPVPPPPGGPYAYGATGEAPQWAVAQWNIPGGRLPDFARSQQGSNTVFSTRSSGASVTVIHSRQGTETQLSQDGAVLPCLNDKGQPREWDLFISPNGTHVAQPGRPGMLRLGPGNPTLDQMTHVTLTATISVRQRTASTRKNCKVNQGGAVVGIILSNTAVKPPQTMFYQVKLSRICGNDPSIALRPCGAVPAKPMVYFATNPFGTDDFLPLLGQPWIANGQTRTLHVDVLPRLIDVIRAGPGAIDHNPAHWVVGGVYAGEFIWGDVALATTWSDFRLAATTR